MRHSFLILRDKKIKQLHKRKFIHLLKLTELDTIWMRCTTNLTTVPEGVFWRRPRPPANVKSGVSLVKELPGILVR